MITAAQSAWDYTVRGENRFGQSGAYVPLDLVNRLATINPDALALLNVLKARNGPNSIFPIANGMADTAIALGWRRLAKARKVIVNWELVEQVAPQTRHKPALYRWPKKAKNWFRVTKVVSNPQPTPPPSPQLATPV